MIDPVSLIADAFATPPSVEAALARDPVLRPAGNGGDASATGSRPDPSAVARFRQALALHEDLAAAREALSAAPAAVAPHAESAEIAQAPAAAREAGPSPFILRPSPMTDAHLPVSFAVPMTDYESPFATPPSIEASLARTPAPPQPGAPDPAAIARFREVIALHEELQADFAASAASLSSAASPILAAPLAPAPLREAGPVPAASASGATRETLAAAASAVLAQTAAPQQQHLTVSVCLTIFQRLLKIIVFLAAVGMVRDAVPRQFFAIHGIPIAHHHIRDDVDRQ